MRTPESPRHRLLVVSATGALVAIMGCSGEPLYAIPDGLALALDLSPDRVADVSAPGHDPAELDAFRAVCNDEAMARLNADSGDYAVPTAPSLPVTDTPLPASCDEALRLEQLIARCGPVVELTAIPERPCGDGRTCHIRLPAGEHRGEVELGCAFLEGEGDATRIIGTINVVDDSVIARVAVEDDYGAISPTANLLVSEASLRGGYEGLSVSWDAELDVAVCRSRVAGGYAGVGQSWGSQRLTVVQSGIAACYEAVSSSWGSEQLHVEENVLFAGYVGVHIHHSLASVAIGNTIFGGYDAVSVSQWGQDTLDEVAGEADPYTPEIVGVFVSGNEILGGRMPSSDPTHDIIIQ